MRKIIYLTWVSRFRRGPLIALTRDMKKTCHLNKIKCFLIFLSCLTLGHSPSVFGQIRCEKVHRPIEKFGISAGANFLHQKKTSLHTSHAIQNQAVHFKNTTGRSIQKPSEKIQAWLNYLEQSYKKYQGNPRAIGHIKKFFYEQFVAKFEEVPESFYTLQERIAREQGRGHVNLSNDQRQQLAEIAIRDQKKSLDAWIEYFLSKDSAMYPIWTKYWSLMAIVKMGKFDPETGTFNNRGKGQMSPFPELNREALSLVIDSLVKKVEGKSLDDIKDPVFLSLIDGASFSKLYGRALLLAAQSKQNLNSAQGKWITYKQGSNYWPLVKSLNGKNTGWCTAGESTAKEQLKEGDFHVFYSYDEHGEPTVPRIAIRMSGGSIAEVRGVAKNQHLDPQIAETPVLQNKLNEFGSEGKSYLKKTAHMKRLTEIEHKHIHGMELSSEDIRFLYEIDEGIVGMGYGPDPRVEEIKKQRNTRQDLSKTFNVKESEVSLNQEEALRGGIKFHYGDLSPSEVKSAEGLKLPQSISGNLFLDKLESAEGLILPKFIGGILNLANLKSAKGLVFPQYIGKGLALFNLQSAEGLILPKFIGGDLDLRSLKSMVDLEFPQSVEGEVDLRSLQSAEGLILPKSISGSLNLHSLKSAKGLKFPQSVGGDLTLSKLESAEDLKLPQSVGSLALHSLQSVKYVKFPEYIRQSLVLSGLRSTEGLVLPKGFRGKLILDWRTVRYSEDGTLHLEDEEI